MDSRVFVDTNTDTTPAPYSKSFSTPLRAYVGARVKKVRKNFKIFRNENMTMCNKYLDNKTNDANMRLGSMVHRAFAL